MNSLASDCHTVSGLVALRIRNASRGCRNPGHVCRQCLTLQAAPLRGSQHRLSRSNVTGNESLFIAGEMRELGFSGGKPRSRSPFEFRHCSICRRCFHRTLAVLAIGASCRTMIWFRSGPTEAYATGTPT